MPKTKNVVLSERQRECFDYLKRYKKQYPGRSPTLREIGDHMTVSRERASEYLKRLQELGYITVKVEFQRQEIEIV